MTSDYLSREDYEERACPFCRNTDYHIPLQRVLERLDSLLTKNDTAAAEQHLNYWLADARGGGDSRGELAVQEELMGFYRKQGRKEEALDAAQQALALLDRPELASELAAATVRLNAATVYTAFGRAAEALPLFERARSAYEANLMPGEARLGGLYNNMALGLSACGRYADARELFDKALHIMEQRDGTEPEQAVTELNLANLDEAEFGYETAEKGIEARLDRAESLLKRAAKNGYTAFTMEKCAPTFDYYGFFAAAAALRAEAAALYAQEAADERT